MVAFAVLAGPSSVPKQYLLHEREGPSSHSRNSNATEFSSDLSHLRTSLRANAGDSAIPARKTAQLRRRQFVQTTTLLPVFSTLIFSEEAVGDVLTNGSVRLLDPQFATQLTSAVYDAFTATGNLSEAEFQKEFFKLRQQEFRFMKEANFGDLSALQQPGDLSQVPYYNFVSYVQWKIAGRNITSLEDRSAFNLDVGRRLLRVVLPDAACQGPAPSAVHQAALGSDIARGSGAEPSSSSSSSASASCPASLSQAGGVEQLKSQIEALLQKLVTLGYLTGYSAQWTALDSEGWAASRSGEFSLNLNRPADMKAAELLRAETNNFWQRLPSSIIQALMCTHGLDADVDEYFLQDQWIPPKTLGERVLLALGDPLLSVTVPFDADQLLQTWRIRE
eukprot:jgi/Mesen1/7202/ME000371S06286